MSAYSCYIRLGHVRTANYLRTGYESLIQIKTGKDILGKFRPV